MAWIELHQTLPKHRKTLAFKRALGIDTAQAIGHLAMLWLWAIDSAPDGILTGVYADDLSEVCGWDGNPKIFFNALVTSGFIDADTLSLHNWDVYTAKLIDGRENRKRQNRDRQRAYREKQKNGNIDEDSNVNITRDCHAPVTPCHAATIPYRTVPYPTVPNLKIIGVGVEETENLNEPVENREDAIKAEFTRSWSRPPTQQEAAKAIGLIANLCGEVTTDGIEILGNALDSCIDHNACTLSYLSGIFKKLKERGIKTADDYYGYDIERCKRRKA